MKRPVYLDATKDIETRVNDLLRRMTVDEKINQMYTTGCNELEQLLEKFEKGEKPDISATFAYFGYNVETYNRLQRYQIENSRLKIPFILACENTHGVSNPLCTIFPTTGCMAATFDDKLIAKVADATAKEARVMGISQVYAPNIDISWDLRWGRVEENFGEDPYLTSKMGVAIVKSFQKNKVAATVKHYIAYGLGESGINLAPAHVGVRDIREYMLPPFEACVKEGKAWSVMPSYSEIDGVPVHSSPYWMTEVLRKELDFDGMVITDYGASNMLYGFHRVIDAPVEAGKILCENQVDMEGCGYFGYNAQFRELVKSGKYPISKVNECVKNILRMKFRLGLFENPYAPVEKMDKVIHNKKHVALAREVAEKGIVLLKNDGVLPMKGDKKIALIGPNGNIAQLGNYIYYGYFDENYKGRCIAEESLSMQQVLEKIGANFVFEQGCDFEKTNDKMLQRAYEAAAASDVVWLALGTNSKGGKCGGEQIAGDDGLTGALSVTSGEGYDMHEIDLTPPQKELFAKVKEAGKPIVLILYGGKPLAITEQVDGCAAIVFAFGVGEQGNEALYDILTGKVNPSGKLPISFPRSTGHLPCYYNHKPSARGSFYQRPGEKGRAGRDYVFDSPKSLFTFGDGLSYTKYQYTDLQVERVGRYAFNVSVNVENVGDMDGEESVLLFLSAKVQRVTPVVKKLRAFTRIALRAGEKKTVRFRLGKADFSYVGLDMKKQVATGGYTVSIGNLEGTFEV